MQGTRVYKYPVLDGSEQHADEVLAHAVGEERVALVQLARVPVDRRRDLPTSWNEGGGD
jgi:hypothetical protein